MRSAPRPCSPFRLRHAVAATALFAAAPAFAQSAPLSCTGPLANTDADKALLKRFNLFGPPGLIFWDGTGAQSDYKVIGFEKADKFLASINSALGQ